MKKPILTLLLILTALPLHAAETQPAWKEAVAAIDAGNLAPMQTLADAGDAAAQHSLGVLYEKGEGVPADAATAAAWYHKAAAQGYASAQYNLALMYRDGRGVARDAAQAQHWYEQAAAQGHAKAQYRLGEIAYGEKHYDTARDWFEKSAAQGYAKAQYHLGQHYRNRDPQKARAWLEKAAAQDNADAKKALQTW